MYFQLKIYHSQPREVGYLLHKHPDRYQQFHSNYGLHHLFYPEIAAKHICFALISEIDPIVLVRRSTFLGNNDGYVNDRPYVCGSLFSAILSKVLNSALNGHCKERPDLVEKKFDLELALGMIKIRENQSIVRQLFESLGYEIQLSTQDYPEHSMFTAESSSYMHLLLKGKQTLSAALRHLYVLLPVLDLQKHYYFSQDEMHKLLEKGRGWLEGHPAQALIVKRYLYRRPDLVRQALKRLNAESLEQNNTTQEEVLEKPISLNEQRIQAVVTALGKVQSVVDLGCGEAQILKTLLETTNIPLLLGVDVASSALAKAERRLNLERRPEMQRQRVQLLHSSVLYRDQRLKGVEAALLIEVIEHLEPQALTRLAKSIWGELQAQKLIVTTPNKEYNSCFGMPASEFRHPDHRFEWNRQEFQNWCETQATEYGYTLCLSGIGPEHENYGCPTQMALFTRETKP